MFRLPVIISWQRVIRSSESITFSQNLRTDNAKTLCFSGDHIINRYNRLIINNEKNKITCFGQTQKKAG